MEEIAKHFLNNNRRHFLKKLSLGIGGLAGGVYVRSVFGFS